MPSRDRPFAHGRSKHIDTDKDLTMLIGPACNGGPSHPG
jgi:hypothetical protein